MASSAFIVPGNLSVGGTLTMTGALLLADGTQTVPSLAYASETGKGWYSRGTSLITYVVGNGTGIVDISGITNSEHINLKASGMFGISSANADAAAADSGISRLGSASLEFGNGTNGNAAGTITGATINATSAFQANGTPGAATFGPGGVTSLTVAKGIVTAAS